MRVGTSVGAEGGLSVVVALDDAQRSLLAEAIRARQRKLRLTQKELADASGLSQAVVNRLVNERATSVAEATLDGLDRGLQWGAGSLESIMNGGGALPVEAPVLEERTWRDEQGHVWREIAERGTHLTPEQQRVVTEAISRMLDGYGA